MQLVIDKKSYELRFNHLFLDDKRRATRAALENEKKGVEAFAYCHPNDQFSRKEGRKRALARVLKPFPRQQRRQAWLSYFLQMPQDLS